MEEQCIVMEQYIVFEQYVMLEQYIMVEQYIIVEQHKRVVRKVYHSRQDKMLLRGVTIRNSKLVYVK